MNCRQARVMLSAYRDLKNEQTDTTELEIHLAGCSDCRQLLDQYTLLGRRIHTLPRLAAAPGAYDRLMQTLATQHTLHLQRNTTPSQARPVPDFLVPYLHEPETRGKDALTAFSTADTGPLPVIRPTGKQRRYRGTISQFGVIGLAAAFLMLLMTAGLTSMLILAGGKPVNIQPASINIQQSQITPNLYTTNTAFSHVASGIASNNAIYFTAYDDKANWMLEQIATNQQGQVQESIPLLPETSNSPLVVLGSANDWVIWLQLNTPKVIAASKKSTDHSVANHVIRSWSLNSLYLGANEQDNPYVPRTMLSGNFDESTAPDWTHTPIQGLWFLKDTVLIASIDARGVSHLDEYNLAAGTDSTLANATTSGHIFTSPTANTSGKAIYWAEEWQADDGTLHSDIWAQQLRSASPGYGRWQPHIEAHTFLFRDDEASFHPQVINNTLFLLATSANTSNTATAQDSLQVPAQTPAAGTPTTTPTPAIATDASITPQVDPMLYGPQADTNLSGRVLAFNLSDSSPVILPPALGDKVAMLQGGSRFLLYQNSNGNVGLYDTLLGQALTIANTVKNANFLMVNAETAVWMTNPTSSDAQSTSPDTNVQINMFTLTVKKISIPATK